MALWLKDLRTKYNAYTVAQINTIPTGAQGVSVVAALLATSLCMIYPLWSIFTIVEIIFMFANVVLLIWVVPKGLHCELVSKVLSYGLLITVTVACYYLLGVSAAVTPILMPFINMAMRDDAEARAVTVGAMVCHIQLPDILFTNIFAADSRLGRLLVLPNRCIPRGSR